MALAAALVYSYNNTFRSLANLAWSPVRLLAVAAALHAALVLSIEVISRRGALGEVDVTGVLGAARAAWPPLLAPAVLASAWAFAAMARALLSRNPRKARAKTAVRAAVFRGSFLVTALVLAAAAYREYVLDARVTRK